MLITLEGQNRVRVVSALPAAGEWAVMRWYIHINCRSVANRSRYVRSGLEHSTETARIEEPAAGSRSHRRPRDQLEGERGYLFPPFSLIQRCLSNVRREQATVTLICPYWPSQSLLPILLELAVGIPILILHRKNLLTDSDRNLHPRCQSKSFLLSAWRLSGKLTKTKEFWKQCVSFCWPKTAPTHPPLTSQPGSIGAAGVWDKVWIPWRAM